MKFFIGVMSKNIVDAIISFQSETSINIGLIPSRRQIEFDGGYCNNWTTEQFYNYAKGLTLNRDHAGPGQGLNDDDGFESLEHDCKYFDFIHIDPWKKYPEYKDGLRLTIEMIKFCYNLNSKIKFEVGTEESIKRFEPQELDLLVSDLKNALDPNVFKQIKYLVIQSGTSLSSTSNTGVYDKKRLIEMIKIASKYNLRSKEHNGDYMPVELIHEKMTLGLDSINIAPEFGLIETQTYLDNITDPKLLDLFWEICYNSGKWKKWVKNDFDPLKEKEQLIKICGHYVLTNDIFLKQIKNSFPQIDDIIKNNIINKLKQLNGF